MKTENNLNEELSKGLMEEMTFVLDLNNGLILSGVCFMESGWGLVRVNVVEGVKTFRSILKKRCISFGHR